MRIIYDPRGSLVIYAGSFRMKLHLYLPIRYVPPPRRGTDVSATLTRLLDAHRNRRETVRAGYT
jgi:hypothetical protein